MKNQRRKLSAGSIAAICIGAAVVIAALYIMIRGLGLNPELDFGAGAYYYADIPEYQKVLDWDIFQASLPLWVYIVLFLAWGAIMWRLWTRMR